MQLAGSYKEIIKISLPIFGGIFANSIVGLIDIFFLGRLSTTDQSAANYGYLLFLVISLVGMGISTGLQIIIARKSGEGNSHLVGNIFRHGLMIAISYSIIAALFLLVFGESFIYAITSSDELAHSAVIYIQNRAFGLIFSMINLIFVAFYVGTSSTLPITFSAVSGALVNIVMNYILIFGHFGFRAYGIQGAAYATVISESVASLVFFLYSFAFVSFKKYGFKVFDVSDLKIIKEIFSISIPLMAQHFISITAWFVFFTLIENTGKENMEASTNIRAVYSLFLMPSIALGSATNSITSNLIGQGKSMEVLGFCKRVLVLGMSIMLLLTVVLYAKYEFFLSIFTDNEVVIHLAFASREVLSAAVFFMSFGFVFFNIISGTGKTFNALLVESLNILIYIVYIVYVTTVNVGGIREIWFAETLYFFLLGFVSLVYLRYFDRVLYFGGR